FHAAGHALDVRQRLVVIGPENVAHGIIVPPSGARHVVVPWREREPYLVGWRLGNGISHDPPPPPAGRRLRLGAQRALCWQGTMYRHPTPKCHPARRKTGQRAASPR